MVKVEETTQGVLDKISEGFAQKGAFNLRQNGISICHGDSEHIKIKKKEDKPGIDIFIDGETKGEKVFIPVVVSVSGMTDLVYNDIVESVVGLTLDCARCCNLLVGIECSAVLDIREVLVKLCLNFGFFACLRLYDHDFIKVYAHRRKVDGVVVEKVEVKVYHRLCDLSVGDLLGAYPVDRLEYSLCEILGSALCGLALGAALSLGSSCGAVVACSGAA